MPPQSETDGPIPYVPAERKPEKQEGFQEESRVTNRNSAKDTMTNCEEIPRPVAMPQLTGTQDSPMLRDRAQAHALAKLAMDQGLSLDTASEDENVTGHQGEVKKDVSPASFVGDDPMPEQWKPEGCQQRTGMPAGSPRENVQPYDANETVRPVTAPVALMFTAPVPVPDPSKIAVAMHQVWQANCELGGPGGYHDHCIPSMSSAARDVSGPPVDAPSPAHCSANQLSVDPTPIPRGVSDGVHRAPAGGPGQNDIPPFKSPFQAMYDFPVTPEGGSRKDAPEPVIDPDDKDPITLRVPTSKAGETVKTNKRMASAPAVIHSPQILQPANISHAAKVANTSKARGIRTFKRKRNDTPTAAKTPASKSFATATSVDSPRPPPVFQDESGIYYIAEKLIDWRSTKARNGKMVVQVLVFWEGYPREEATWEPMNSIRKDVGEARWQELADALWLCPGDDVEVIRKELLAYHRFRREQRKRENIVIEDSDDEDDATGNPFVDGDVDFF